MIKKFDCKNCKKQFEADDQGVITCPYCHSDNVEPARFHLPSWTGRIGLIIVLVLVVAGAWWLLGKTSFNSDDMDSNDEEILDSLSTDNDSLDYEYVEDIPPTVDITEPVFDGKYYTVTVKAKNVQKGINFYYVRMNHFGDKKVLQKSEDGHFKDIPYCEEDGSSYDFAIMDANSDTLLSTPTPVTGFIRQVSVSKKMTMQELQALIDKRDPSLYGAGENDYLAPDYKLKFVGLPADAVNIPKILAEVIEKLDMESWQKVSVKSLDYDDMNRIDNITLQVIVSDF